MKEFPGWIIALCTISCHVAWIHGQCTDDLLTPDNYPQDSSGVRPDRNPPIALGESVLYQCPGVKQFKGKSEWKVTCKENVLGEQKMDYTENIPVWPECQCDHKLDLTSSSCPFINYTTTFANDEGDKPSQTIWIHLEPDTDRWSLELTMDQSVTTLDVSAEGAGLVPKKDNQILLSSREDSEEDMELGKTAEVTLHYSFGGTTAKRWAHPCIAKVECDIESGKEKKYQTWLIIGIVVAVIVVLMILLYLIFYFCKRMGSSSTSPVTSPPDSYR